MLRRTACLSLLIALAAPAALAQQDAPATQQTPTPVVAVPTEAPSKPGEVPLENPAPVSEDTPRDSAGATPPSGPVPVVPVQNVNATPVLATPARVQTGCSLRDYGVSVERGQIASSIFNTCSGVSLHKPSFLIPFSYSPQYDGGESEFIFQISGKAQLWDFGPGALYFGYSQRSYFQAFTDKKSKAFRETNYNPEIFTRFPKPLTFLPNWSFDLGLEHESNGQDLPDSRSFNRVYFAPYWSFGRRAVQLKTWWRLPEEKNRAIDDPKRDDNPDIGEFYGYTELRYRQDLPWKNQLFDLMVRGNPNTGRGAVQLDYSMEIGLVGAVFVRLFNGYGESLIDYNQSVTRVAVGVALQR